MSRKKWKHIHIYNHYDLVKIFVFRFSFLCSQGMNKIREIDNTVGVSYLVDWFMALESHIHMN